MILHKAPGETVETFAPPPVSVNDSAVLQDAMRVVAANAGISLDFVLLNPSEANFSTSRVIQEQSRHAWRRYQDEHCWVQNEIYRWRVKELIRNNDDVRAKADQYDDEIFSVIHHCPLWPYMDPLKDTQADRASLESFTQSLSQVVSSRNGVWRDTSQSIASSNAMLIAACIEAAKELSKNGVEVTWRDVLSISRESLQTDGATSVMDDESENNAPLPPKKTSPGGKRGRKR
jgi:capsid protein